MRSAVAGSAPRRRTASCIRHGFEATTYTCSASGRWARSACAPRPTRTARPCAAASAITRSVILTIVASSGSTRGTAGAVMNSSGDPTASVLASRSSSPGARSSRSATSSGASPARRATSSTNWLSITVQSRAAATRRATSEPPAAYWRVTVMTGGGISRLQVLAQVADVEQRQPTLGRDEDDQVARALHVVQHLDPLLGEGLGRERLVQEPLLLGLKAGDFDAVALRLDLLLLGDLVVDRLDHLGGRLQVAQEEGGDGGDAELAAAGARRGDERRVHEPFHRRRDLRALGDVVYRELHHAVADALADRVEHGSADLILVPDLGEALGGLHRIDLPANRHLDVHPHLLARERLDRFDLLAARGPLLLAGRVALDRRPGRHEADPGEQGRRVHVAEGVSHAHLARVDHDHGGPDRHQQAKDRHAVAREAEQVGDGTGSLRANGGGREQERQRGDDEDGGGDELAHENSGRGPEGEDTAFSVVRYPSSVRQRDTRMTDDGRRITETNSALRSLPSSRSPAPSTLPARGCSRALRCVRCASRRRGPPAPAPTRPPWCRGPSWPRGPPHRSSRAAPGPR